jgi:hypothetical protein
MTAKHAPGPWRTEEKPFPDELGFPEPCEITDAAGDAIAYVWGEEANARLIATAPELLAALQRVEREFDRLVYLDLMSPEFVSEIRAVINKALGKA